MRKTGVTYEMTPRADTHSRVERERHSRVVGMCWSIVFVSVENLLRMLPSGVVSNSLETRKKDFYTTRNPV